MATASDRLWSWDIAKLPPGPAKWTFFYLYVILDVYSRYVTGWMVGLGDARKLRRAGQAADGGDYPKQNMQPGRLHPTC